MAVNASIEAAKAGENGRGFAVVASEVRDLANQSKRATQQIRSILTDIQKATESTVMAAEEGSKCALDGQQAVESVRQVIDELSAALENNNDKARQISGAARQQEAGISQVSQGLESIATAGQNTAAGASQLETSVLNINGLVGQLESIVSGYRLN